MTLSPGLMIFADYLIRVAGGEVPAPAAPCQNAAALPVTCDTRVYRTTARLTEGAAWAYRFSERPKLMARRMQARLRVGVVRCGELFEISALCDISPELRRRCAEDYGIAFTCEDW